MRRIFLSFKEKFENPEKTRKQKSMKILLFSIIVFSLLSYGCNQASVETVSSNTVMSSQVYQIYTVEAEKGRTDITATFRVGGATGTTLELTESGKISYNDAMLPVAAPSNLIGTNYRMKGTDYRTFTKNYQPNHKFSFTDNEGKTFENSVNLLPLEVSGNSVFTLQISQPTMIPLSRPIGKDEILTVAIDTIIEDQVPTSDNSVYLNENRSAIIITPKYWQTKPLKSKTELKIKVKKNSIVSQGAPIGGSISAVYSATPLMININNSQKATNITAKTENANVKILPKSPTNVSNSEALMNKNSSQK